MFGFLKRKKKDDFESSDPLPDPFDGAGKFPPGADPLATPSEPEQPFPPVPPSAPGPITPPPMPQEDFSNPAQPAAFRQPTSPGTVQPQPVPTPVVKEPAPSGDRIELVLAKLDSLKSMIEVLNQRIANLENKRQW